MIDLEKDGQRFNASDSLSAVPLGFHGWMKLAIVLSSAVSVFCQCAGFYVWLSNPHSKDWLHLPGLMLYVLTPSFMIGSAALGYFQYKIEPETASATVLAFIYISLGLLVGVATGITTIAGCAHFSQPLATPVIFFFVTLITSICILVMWWKKLANVPRDRWFSKIKSQAPTKS